MENIDNKQTLLQSQQIYTNWKTGHSLPKWRHNSIIACIFFKKYFGVFLIKSWEAIENFSFIAITKKKLSLIEVGGGPKAPPSCL